MDDVAALVAGIAIRFGVNSIVMTLGVGRIDGDERKVAPVLAAFEGGGLCRLGLAQRRGRKRLRDLMGVDRDQADRLFGGERAEPLLHLTRGEAIGPGADEVGADEIA